MTTTDPAAPRRATLYRMVMPEHVFPFGLKSKWQLERHGYFVDDRWLTARAETDAFMAAQGVTTTPQTVIDGARIGGNDALTRFFGGHVPGEGEMSCTPVIAVFATAALLAIAASVAAFGTPVTVRASEWFVTFAMAILAMPKMQDVEQFSTMFLNYDLLTRRW